MRRDPRLLAVLVVALVVGALAWAAAVQPKAVTASPALSAAAQAVPITQNTLVCPQAGGAPAGKGNSAGVAYANTDTDSSDLSSSSVTATPLDPDGVAAPVAAQAGRAWIVDGPKTAGPLEVNVNGPLATTTAATQFLRESSGATWQLAAAPCEGPTTDSWFAGFSSGVGAHATLLLSNVDNVPATVDIGLFGDSTANPSADHGVPVPPQTQVAVQLDALAPGLTNAVAHVTATAGRIVPALRYDVENGSLPLGVDWIPRTDGPATSLTVPGIAPGPGSRRLVLANPGDVDATASLNLVTTDGSFTPTGLDVVNVPAGQVISVPLDTQLQGEAAAVVVTSSEPVVAGGAATLPLDKAGGSDVAFTAAVPALSGPAAASGGEFGPGRRTKLLLTAPGADAHVTVTLLPSSSTGSPVVSPLTVPAGTTMTLDSSSLSRDPAPAIEVTPQPGGQVFAAWVVEESSASTADLTSFPLRAQPQVLLRPHVRADLLAGLPGGPVSSVQPSPAPASEPPSSPPASEPASAPASSPAQESSPESSSQPSP